MMLNPWVLSVPSLAVAGTGVAAWAAVHPSAQIYGPTIRVIERRDAIALTFDDGPNPAITPRLLDLLDQYNARATFFVIGRFVRVCPGLAREIVARGHALGNHTDTHPNLLWLSRVHIAEELHCCGDALAQATGRAAHWMRPPYGFRGPQLDRVVRRHGIRGVVLWSVIAHDWRPQPAARLIQRLRYVGGGDIVVLHDGNHRALGGDRQHVLGALAYWLPRWRDAGLEFVTMDAAMEGVERKRRSRW